LSICPFIHLIILKANEIIGAGVGMSGLNKRKSAGSLLVVAVIIAVKRPLSGNHLLFVDKSGLTLAWFNIHQLDNDLYILSFIHLLYLFILFLYLVASVEVQMSCSHHKCAFPSGYN